MIFPNGVKILAKKHKILDGIFTGPTHDTQYINNQFFVFIKEKHLRKQIGKNRKEVLEKLRDSSKYDLMRLIYEYRVLSDGNGDVSN